MGLSFPWGTVTVNLLGSFLVGVCMVLIAGKTAGAELWRLGLMVGLLGGFTTFSAFSLLTLVYTLLTAHSFKMKMLCRKPEYRQHEHSPKVPVP